jgi:hypothetical protein
MVAALMVGKSVIVVVIKSIKSKAIAIAVVVLFGFCIFPSPILFIVLNKKHKQYVE